MNSTGTNLSISIKADVAKLLEKADRLEEAAARALAILDIEAGSFKKMITTAQAFALLKAALTDDFMAEIMPLMNTSLGFRTDKDPNQTDKQGKPHVPYSVAVVRDVLVEGALRRARWWGNEINIIAGKLYLTLPYYERMVREFPGVTDIDARPGVPAMIGEDGALVPYFVSWKLHGKEMRMERKKVSDVEDTRFCIRRNAGMGIDAVLGKARKRAFAAVFGMITGKEDEVEDDVIDVTPSPGSKTDQGTLDPPDEGSNGDAKSKAKAPPPKQIGKMFGAGN